MKHTKPSVISGKYFVLLSFLSLLFVSPSSISAQDSIRRISSADRQPKTERGDVISGHREIADEAAESASQNQLSAFSLRQTGSVNHGIIDVRLAESEIETKSEISVAPKSETASGESRFSDDFRSSGRQSKFDFTAGNYLPAGKDSVPMSPASAKKFAKTGGFSDDPTTSNAQNEDDSEGFRWRPAIQQALLFLAVQHGYAMTQPKTREALKGRFFHDYIESVKSLHGWDDGGRFFTNYLAHPMQGSFVGFIQIQNDPKGMKQRFGTSGDYWRSRMKAMAWSAAWSTQFEIGPISQASIGNVGLKGKQTWEDIIVTPTVGTAMLISEDALDRFVIERIERSTNNFYLTIFSRMLLNPTRTVANLIRFKHPWYRDRARAR